MKNLFPCFMLSFFLCGMTNSAFSHDGTHAKNSPSFLASTHSPTAPGQISGQGKFKFRVFQTRDILPQEALAVLEKAHGGFAVDRRPGKGEVYFTLPGAGIIQLSPSFNQAKLIPTAPVMKNTNLHNTTLWYPKMSKPRLVFPANNSGKIFTASLDGTLLDTLDAPSSSVSFDHSQVNQYFKAGGKFVPTDVEYMNSLYYITTGYSKLDYVLTAKVHEKPLSTAWNPLSFGGKGNGKGQFQTGHGITISPEGTLLDIADRPLAEIDRFTPEGKYRQTIDLPKGSFPCDIDYGEGLAVVACLHGPDRKKGAPVYLLQNNHVVSTIMPKEELGLERFQHIHNAVLVKRDGVMYIILQAWNPGDFVVLQQIN